MSEYDLIVRAQISARFVFKKIIFFSFFMHFWVMKKSQMKLFKVANSWLCHEKFIVAWTVKTN